MVQLNETIRSSTKTNRSENMLSKHTLSQSLIGENGNIATTRHDMKSAMERYNMNCVMLRLLPSGNRVRVGSSKSSRFARPFLIAYDFWCSIKENPKAVAGTGHSHSTQEKRPKGFKNLNMLVKHAVCTMSVFSRPLNIGRGSNSRTRKVSTAAWTTFKLSRKSEKSARNLASATFV